MNRDINQHLDEIRSAFQREQDAYYGSDPWDEYGSNEGEPILMHKNKKLRIYPSEGAYFLQDLTPKGWVNAHWAKHFKTVKAAKAAGQSGGPSF